MSAPKAARNPSTPRRPASGPEPGRDDDDGFGWLGERLRRVALGLTAMLFVARAYYPSEDAETGTGLVWVFALLAVAALAIASMLFAGTTRLRWSWADAAVLSLMGLVGLAASHAAGRRPAITMAWEWGGMALLYFLVRTLPRTRAESSTLAGAVVATAVAVAAYGLYQVPVEFAQLRQLFVTRPEVIYFNLGIAPGSPSAEGLKQRMYSNEPFSTFALPGSLAGFLVGPMALAFAVALENLRREARGSKLVALAMAAVPGLTILVCLVLTKSRSAWVGLFAAVLVLAWRARGVVRPRVLALSGVGLGLLLGGLVAAGVATRQLDREVITQATKSLRYRWEYWVGAWGLITDAPSPFASAGLGSLPGGPEPEAGPRGSRVFWSGVGPANFAGPYLRHKLPEASEEVQDPHNMVLEVWAEAGVFAAMALLAALGIGLREILGPTRPGSSDPRTAEVEPEATSPAGPTAPPRSSGWLLAMAGLGWVAVWALGKLNPVVQGDLLWRWLILGAGWSLAVLLGAPLWRRRPIPAAGLGVGVLATAINLMAAGGIGIPSVAMSLWVLLALGLNLRDDRPCGRPRVAGGLGPALGLACVWAMLAGTYYGAVVPSWKSEAALAEGDAAMAAKPPAFEVARRAYMAAIEADHYDTRPWLALANLEYRFWKSPEVAARKEKEAVWTRGLIAIDDALDPKWRDPDNLDIRRTQASFARTILGELPTDAKPFELLGLRSTIVKACRNAARIYPTSATIRAELAQASADLGMYPDAAREARQALRLDSLTPHRDKKLADRTRAYLAARAPLWDEQAKVPPPKPAAAPAPPPQGVAR